MEIGYTFAIAAAVIWGLVYALDQKILSDVSPLSLLFIFSVIASFILLPILIISGTPVKETIFSDKFNWPLIILSGVLAMTANLLILLSIKNLDASAASIIEIAYPFFVVLFSFIIFKSLPNAYFFLGGAFIFIGTVIIVKFS